MNPKAIFAIILVVVCVSAFTIASFIRSNKVDFLNEHGISTIGTINELRGDYLRIRYFANDNQITWGVKRPYSGFQVGEQYELLYNPQDPETIKVQFDKPVISKSFQTTNPISIQERTSGSVTYKFDIEGERITRIGRLPVPFSNNLDEYLVAYDPENPLIGYLIKKTEYNML